jgi:hypothetical protein
LSDCCISGVQLCGSSISIDGVGNLVVTALVQTPEVEPDLRDIGINANSPRVSVQGIPILVDLEVQHSDRTPESWVTTVTINSLLISLIRLVVFLASHVGAAKEVPALGIMGV